MLKCSLKLGAFNRRTSVSPITIEAYDNTGSKIFSYQVEFSWEINVEEILERAFAANQTASKADPFTYTVGYFGYSQTAAFPGYLGYEVESINSFASNASFYWNLAVNGINSSTGIDTTFPNPGATVTLRYTAIDAPTTPAASSRTKAIQERRASREGA
jgi:hypothetical protein